MDKQIQLCNPKTNAASSACTSRALPNYSAPSVLLARPRSAGRSVALFLLQTAAGGALGGYALLLGTALYFHQRSNLGLIITLPFVLFVGAVLGLFTGAFTLLVEDLIEEKLSAVARVIVTSMIAILSVSGLAAFWNPVNWQLLKMTSLPGVILGLPIGLLGGSRLRPWRTLLLGVDDPPRVEAYAASGPTSFLSAFSLIGGFALRLASVTGLLITPIVLACRSSFQPTDELMVTVFAVYYFACTAYITCAVRNRWMIGIVGTALNALLLVLAVLWDPIAAENGQPGPLMVAFLTLTFLWLLFSLRDSGLSQPKKELLPRNLES
jgi:hypothetical protein